MSIFNVGDGCTFLLELQCEYSLQLQFYGLVLEDAVGLFSAVANLNVFKHRRGSTFLLQLHVNVLTLYWTEVIAVDVFLLQLHFYVFSLLETVEFVVVNILIVGNSCKLAVVGNRYYNSQRQLDFFFAAVAIVSILKLRRESFCAAVAVVCFYIVRFFTAIAVAAVVLLPLHLYVVYSLVEMAVHFLCSCSCMNLPSQSQLFCCSCSCIFIV